MSDNSAVKDPFVRVVKRDGMKSGAKIAVRIASVIVALIACGVLIYMITGLNPLVVYETMFQGAFGSTRILEYRSRGTDPYRRYSFCGMHDKSE